VITFLPEYVTRHAGSHADDIAVVMGDDRLSYGQLEASSNRLAHWLEDVGCQRGDRVSLLASKTPDAVIGILGILKAGCAYVPLDVDGPATRTRKMMRSADPKAVVAEGASFAAIPELMSEGKRGPIPIARIDAPTEGAGRGVGEEWKGCSPEERGRTGNATDMAYIVFTSGSTGDPKGVVITHANVTHFVEWAIRRFDLGTADRNSGHTPLHFDLSVFDLFGTFAAGAQLHLVPPEKNLVPQALIEFIGASRLTQWFSVPSTLTYMARHAALEKGDFPSLKRVLWCGEVLPVSTLLYWMDRFPHVEFTNLYGPTETTVASSYFTVPAGSMDEIASIPIGVPCDGEELLVLDEDLQRVPVGHVGDLYIGGVGLSPGYWRDERKTAEAFLPHPFASEGKERIYRTGDLATQGDDGLFYFHGRNDSQIKSRGYRIELGEIETAIDSLGLVSGCVVLGVSAGGFQGTAICCAYIPLPDQAIPPHVLRSALLPVLPTYMLPSRWRSFDEFPMNANGKIDRRALRDQFEEERVTEDAHHNIERVSRLMLNVMHVEVDSIDTDLIESGVIDSLALVELIFQIEQELGINIRLDEVGVESFRTVKGIAGLITTLGAPDD
jgi:amino acid adenylation domain-containing protein